MTSGQIDDLHELRVLLVEDSPADAFLVREAIRAEGLRFHLEVADDGELALAILDRIDAEGNQPALNLLLLDLKLPRHDGTEILERLRQSSCCGNVPVIIMSSSDAPSDRRRAFELGATEYFCKPSSLREFMRLGKLVRSLCTRQES